MRKTFLVVALTVTLVLSGCSIVRDIQTGLLPKVREFQLNASIPSDRQEMENTAQQIIAALDARDKEALRSLFSKKALSEADDMDEGLAYIMEAYQGTSQTYGYTGRVVDDHFGPPGRTKLIFGHYNVETDYDTYELFFEYQMIDEANPEAVGLAYVRIFDSDMWDKHKGDVSSSVYGKLGIYTPDWEKEVKKDDE